MEKVGIQILQLIFSVDDFIETNSATDKQHTVGNLKWKRKHHDTDTFLDT